MQNSEIQKCVVKLKVSPKASRNAIVGWHGNALKVSVTAVPERGKANTAVIELLAAQLALAKNHFRIVRGQSGRDKTVEIDMDLQTLKTRLAAVLAKA